MGAGAVFFHLANYYDIPKAYLSDINPELVLCFRVIQQDLEAVILQLADYHEQYHKRDTEARKAFFYEVRAAYNEELPHLDFKTYSKAWVARAAKMIFLNKTCFNGLFRVNRKGGFNVPHGRYKKPAILDEPNLRAVSQKLQNADIRCADYTYIDPYFTANSFAYFDPPYRPISKTSSFTAYSTFAFNDKEQTRLGEFMRSLSHKGGSLMLSNSDPQSADPEDDFFEILYQGFSLHRVRANRMINSKGSKRGKVGELVIVNYD